MLLTLLCRKNTCPCRFNSRKIAFLMSCSLYAVTDVTILRRSSGGVASELLGRLFEPHFSTTSEGSGLGLAVVQRVATNAGGTVEARNVDGGLEVRLLFPLRA